MLGHSGDTTDFPPAQWQRDVLVMEWDDGTAQIQKLVIAPPFIGRDGIDAKGR
jgi:hypothetical protein